MDELTARETPSRRRVTETCRRGSEVEDKPRLTKARIFGSLVCSPEDVKSVFFSFNFCERLKPHEDNNTLTLTSYF